MKIQKLQFYCQAVVAVGVLSAFSAMATGLPDGGNNWTLVWADEFDRDGEPDPSKWNFETGFVRNHELQWYKADNAVCRDGVLMIEAREESLPNHQYVAGSDDWRKDRQWIECTSASLNTRGKMDFTYGRLEVRAKIPTASGAWPAIWLLGNEYEWPSCGEIDVMEYYRINDVPHILANAAWGSDRPYNAVWNSRTVPFSHFLEKDPEWGDKFHVWTMDWTEDSIKIYLDGELINDIDLKLTVNGKADGKGVNPFRKPQYVLLNLAIAGDHGGEPQWDAFPLRYEVDYVSVYQKK